MGLGWDDGPSIAFAVGTLADPRRLDRILGTSTRSRKV
jgi:hypothetical protein